jgi:phosphomannomutase/phosphoglucomutase
LAFAHESGECECIVNTSLFREYDIRGIVGDDLTDDLVLTIACAIGTYFRANEATRIALGFDARQSSPRFSEILTKGLTSTGCSVVQIGAVTTPLLYHTVFTAEVDGGVMITGSHNPADHNGFKICLGKMALFGDQIREIAAIAEKGEFAFGSGKVETKSVLERYLGDLSERISMGPRKLKAVVDAGNGMGGVTAVPLYRSLGIDLIELYTDPDPTFPNHHADPTVADNLVDLVNTVRSSGADLGIAFDGDGDRLGIVDNKGRIIWGDELLVLFARDVLPIYPGTPVIAEVKCSQTLFDEIERLGGIPIMWKAGHSIIKAKMKESGAKLAGEMSGHFFFADRFYGFDDAAYAGARLLEILSRSEQPLSKLLADLPPTFSTPELRVPCDDQSKFLVVDRIAEYFSRNHDVNTTDGARISFEDGWGLVRPSNTQALLVLRFEASTAEALADIRNVVEAKLTEFVAAVTNE